MGVLEALDSASSSLNSINLATPGRPVAGASGATPASAEHLERTKALLAARAAQYAGMAGSTSQFENDLDFLSKTVNTPPRRVMSGRASEQLAKGTPLVAGAPKANGSTGGFNLNYDVNTPVRAIDVGGPDQAQKIAEFVTSSLNNVSHGLTVRLAMDTLGLQEKTDVLPGLEVKLLGHQCIGVAWMLKQERGKLRGGILADDMGLGKTVQMIATMAMNMPNSEDKCRVTLTVVPAALMQQWKDEIDSKSNGVFRTHIHHGKDKLKNLSDFDDYDVVITTYHTLNGDFSIPKDVDTDDEGKWLAQNGGVLARMKFFRVIADEAQYIRNRGTRSSIAMAHVQSKIRWMLTGTPVTNTLADIYGLLRFGRFRPWNDWNDFNVHVAKYQTEDAIEAGRRAQAILLPLIMRRTKDSKLEGKPILDLKPKHIDIITLKFSDEEQELYNSFQTRTQLRINKFIREGALVKNHSAVLVMILRLRQLSCHPHLILSLSDDLEDPTLMLGGAGEKELSRAIKSKGRPWVDKVKAMFLQREMAMNHTHFLDDGEDVPDESCANCKDMFASTHGRILSCGHEMCFDCTLDLRNAPINNTREFGNGTEKENLAIEKKYEEADLRGHRPCPTCHELVDMKEAAMFKSIAFEPSPEEITVARRHMREKQMQARRRRRQGSDVEMSDEEEVKVEDIKPQKTFEELGLDDSDDDMPDMSQLLVKKETKKGKGKGNATLESDDDELDITMADVTAPLKFKKKRRSSTTSVELMASDEELAVTHSAKKRKMEKKAVAGGNTAMPDKLVKIWKRGGNDMEPSTKMVKMLEYIKEAMDAGDKTIVYSQWTSLLNLVEVLLTRHGIRSLRFDGKMDKNARDKTLSTFRTPEGPKVILISTKCGGVGLNLISANRIVNMDLSWNYASESQAYDRAHRIGQDKEVYVKRLVVEGTIEERMLQLQDVKVGLAEAALGEGAGTKLNKMSVKEIKFLFGLGPPATQQGHKRDGDIRQLHANRAQQQ